MPDSPEPSPTNVVSLCDVVAVVIRMLVLWFVFVNSTAMISLIGRALIATQRSPTSLGTISFVLGYMVILLLCYWIWQFSPALARRITRGRPSALPPTHFDLSDLYSFAFVLVGLTCLAEAVGPTITWSHYVVTNSSSSEILTDQQKSNFYTLFSYAVTLIVGFALTFNARKFAAKLLRRQKSDEDRPVAAAN